MNIFANTDIPISDIKINDKFWNKYRELVGKVIIPYQWEVLNDRLDDVPTSHAIENYKIAAGLSNGKYEGAVFQDTDLAKWLEAVGFYLSSYGRDERLEELADYAIDLIGKAQQPDGYLDTYFIINAPDKKWINLEEGHELYTAGHLMEAAVAYYEATGKKAFLDIVCRLADLLCDKFGFEEGKCHGYPGHPEVEVGLVKLYRTTGEKKYLDLAKYFIDARGVGENYFLKEEKNPDYLKVFPSYGPYDTSYSQSHKPVREQTTAEGHSVRAGYLFAAMADLALETDDKELLDACKRLWKNMTRRRMYITGGIGSSGFLERFTTDYDLPNDCNYSESCASIALAMFGKRMAKATHDASYIDDVERALYNTVLAGIAMDGKSFFYVNPLEVWPASCMDNTSKAHVKSERQKWFGVACCPPNIARTLASIGQYIYLKEDNKLFVNLYISNETRVKLGEANAVVKLETAMPWNGSSEISVDFADGAEQEYELYLRLPSYIEDYKIRFEDGTEVRAEVEKGYAVVRLSGSSKIKLEFEMPAKFVRANTLVRADAGKVALVKGPLVYCIEEIDNGDNLSAIYADRTQKIKESFEKDLLGGSEVLEIKAKRAHETEEEALYTDKEITYTEETVKAIPYCYWGNRAPGEEMLVWMHTK